MTMTRHHFESLAAIVRDARAQATTLGERNVCDWFEEDLIRLCREENPRFDQERFQEACRKVA